MNNYEKLMIDKQNLEMTLEATILELADEKQKYFELLSNYAKQGQDLIKSKKQIIELLGEKIQSTEGNDERDLPAAEKTYEGSVSKLSFADGLKNVLNG